MICCRILLLCVAAIVALASLPTTQVSAFSTSPPSRGSTLKGSSSNLSSSLSRLSSTSHTALYAVKKAAKKSSKKKSDGEDVVNFKKADFVSAVAEKTGMTKAESDLALAAVLNVIATVSDQCKQV